MLAFTGALSYLATALVATFHAEWPMTAAASSLALTSLWYHTTQMRVAYWLDQMAIVWFVGQCHVDGFRRGTGPFLFVVAMTGYACTVYHCGRRWGCLAYGPNGTLWHASIHGLSAFVISTLYLFSRLEDK